MVAISFSKKEFVDKILNGTKTQTCRGKNRFKIGDKLQLYYKQRSKECFKIADAICVYIMPVLITKDKVFEDYTKYNTQKEVDIEKFLKADGFDTIEDFKNWFVPNIGDVWEGYLIKWELVK